MRKSTRVFILLGVFEVLLAAGTAFMFYQVTTGAWRTFDQAEAIQRIFTIMGGAMGAIAGVFLLLGLLIRMKGD